MPYTKYQRGITWKSGNYYFRNGQKSVSDDEDNTKPKSKNVYCAL